MSKYTGTQTEKKLRTAFAGEAGARSKYTFFASKAKKEGFEQIAALFLKTADNETLCLPSGVGVDVHSRVDIRVSQQLLHILGGRAVGEKIAGERVPQHVEVKVLQARDLLLCPPAQGLSEAQYLSGMEMG